METIASKLKNPRELGLSADAVYFEDQTGWRVVPKSGGTPAPMLDDGAIPKNLRAMAVAFIASEGKVFIIARRSAP